MADKTTLALPGRSITVPSTLKRAAEVALALACTAMALLVIVTVATLLTAKGGSFLAGWRLWLGFIQRPDIQATMLLTAIVSVLTAYWQRSGK